MNNDGIIDGGDSDGDGFADNVGGPLNPNGGTLVYNRRGTVVPTVTIPGEGGEPATTLQGGAGPLNDPTAMMYVRLDDLEPRFIVGTSPDGTNGIAANDVDDRCEKVKDYQTGDTNWTLMNPECPVQLKPNAPVEPLVLRANAGDCVEINLHNKLVDQATAGGEPVWYNDNGVEKSLFEKVEYDKLVLQGKSFHTASNPNVTAADIKFDDVMPDLAGWQDLFWVVNRHMMDGQGNFIPPDQRRAGGQEMHFFNNNLIRPSAMAGIHAQLVEFDMSKDDGVVAGQNRQSTVVGPRAQRTYTYYAGHIDLVSEGTEVVEKGKNKGTTTRNFRRRATPVEFGGSNLLSADRVKQPQKGLYGALVIEPQYACHEDTAGEMLGDPAYPDQQVLCEPAPTRLVADGQGIGYDTRLTRAQATIDSPKGLVGDGGVYDEAVSVAFRIANLRWADGLAIANINQGELGREGTEDSGHAGFNYGSEPSWFRFELQPDAPFGNAGTPGSFGAIENVHAFYANGLTTNGTMDDLNYVPNNADISSLGDPATPVFRQAQDKPGRMHLLNGASADRDAVFVLHGHVWQRDPYVCPGDDGTANLPVGHSFTGLDGMCSFGSIGSLALGTNPIGKYLGGEEGMGHAYGHWPILYNAGGTNGIPGDYLFRDYAPSGNRNGMFGILRVGPVPQPQPPAPAGATGGQ